MSLYKDFLALGYTDSEALELTHLAEDFEDGSVADIESDEAAKIIIDKFNELCEGNECTTKVIYETGVETPEIFGSGSSFSSVITTTDENEAFRAYRSGNRNYLLRVTYSIDRPRMIERWDKEQKCWRT